MDFLKQYIKIINYSIMGIVFAFSSFYFFANCYHYLELRRDYVTNINDLPVVNNIISNINKIEDNVKKFDSNNYKGKISTNVMIRLNKNLTICVDNLNNDTFKEIINKNRVNIVDVYKLRESFENNVLNTCIVNNISWLTLDNNDINSDYLKANKELITKHINLLLTNTSYLKKDLLNNSSYFYSTDIASSSIKNNTKDGFYEVLDSYNAVADFILYISNWYKMEVEG